MCSTTKARWGDLGRLPTVLGSLACCGALPKASHTCPTLTPGTLVGFALVYRASLMVTDGSVEPVAVKVLKPDNHFKPQNYRKFLQEVAFHTSMQHR